MPLYFCRYNIELVIGMITMRVMLKQTKALFIPYSDLLCCDSLRMTETHTPHYSLQLHVHLYDTCRQACFASMLLLDYRWTTVAKGRSFAKGTFDQDCSEQGRMLGLCWLLLGTFLRTTHQNNFTLNTSSFIPEQ